MPVTRRYLCDDCNYEWSYLHLKRDEDYPNCPNCSAAEPASIPTTFAINTVKSKAIDFTQKMAEEDYGLTNMRDNMREGDVAAMAPDPVQSREAQELTMAVKEAQPDLSDAQVEQVHSFWQKGVSGVSPDQMRAQAAPAAAEARSLGADPIEMLHKAEKQAGRQGLSLDVVGRAKMQA